MIVVRVAGAVGAITSGVGASYVVSKLYTGRDPGTPIRAALHEQPVVVLVGLAGIALGLFIVARPREFVAARRWLNPAWVWRERKAEAAMLALSGMLGLGVLEVGSRALYAHDERFPFTFPAAYLVYPPLYHAMRDYDPKARNALLLGGSVLYGAGREGQLERALGPPWRVYNLAQNAHSSLDSFEKYRYLLEHGYRFDVVVLYEAINEVRANNAPPRVFRADYSHYLFYRLVHSVFDPDRWLAHAALNSALVFRVDRLVFGEAPSLGREFVSVAYPRADWLKYGADIKSAATFEANLLAISELALEHGSRLIVGEFAYDPRLDDYVSNAAGAPVRPWMIEYTKEWGLPENAQKGIVAHDAIIRKHADRYTFLPTESLKRRENFKDPCHFTPEANPKFVDFWASALR